MRVLAFSKNLAYRVGGAEKSLHAIIDKNECNNEITVASVAGVTSFNADRFRMTGVDVQWLYPRLLTSRFFYNEYFVNRSIVSKYFMNSSFYYDELWAQNIWAPAAINSFDGRTVYFARDESFLNIRSNVHQGLKKVAKYFYELADFPGFLMYKYDNRMAIDKADEVIANSEYMAREIKTHFSRDSKIILPDINKESLKNEYFKVREDIPVREKGIVLLGDTLVKGVDEVIRLASDMPKEKFYIFGRGVNKEKKIGNINYMPWVSNPVHAFKYASVVLVPSVWAEAYGRVAAESVALEIPCIVNNIGGLPEAVDYQENYISNSYADLKCKLKKVLSNYG